MLEFTQFTSIHNQETHKSLLGKNNVMFFSFGRSVDTDACFGVISGTKTVEDIAAL